MGKHEVRQTSKCDTWLNCRRGYWEIYCPKADDKLNLTIEPKFCPMCGKELKRG